MSSQFPGPGVRVRVPGSTSNCGAGFDTLGLALSVYNTVEVRLHASSPKAVALDPRSEAAQAMVEEAAAAYFERAGVAPRGFFYAVTGDVPPARGLGSSITVRLGVVAALNALLGSRLSRHDLAALATDLEGHPDNAVAGALGGFCVPRTHPDTGTLLDVVRAEIGPEAVFVVASPAVEVLTKESRGRLPSTLAHRDAVRSVNSATYLAAAIIQGRYDHLRGAVSDFLHEPYRLPHIPGARAAIDAGIHAGAWTGWLSGSGSSVLCMAPADVARAVATAMREAFAALEIPAEARLLIADNRGYEILDGAEATAAHEAGRD